MTEATPVTPELFIGVDVQVRRGCPYYVLSAAGHYVTSGWLGGRDAAAADLRRVTERLARGDPAAVAVGIDAPRMPLASPRAWAWSGKRGRWSRTAAGATAGMGRHCEIVIAAHRLANPQWTPVRAAAPDWMRLGFELFAALAHLPHVYEIFPSAAYRQLESDRSAEIGLSFVGFARGPKDMLDAALGAYVVREFVAGAGCEVGGGDGLGTIILPRPISVATGAVHAWPSTPEPAA